MAPEACRKPRTTVYLQGKGRHFDKLKKALLDLQAEEGPDAIRVTVRQTGKTQATGAQ